MKLHEAKELSNDKAVIVFSGGQDSTTMLLLAIKKYGKENVHAVTYRWGQSNAAEINRAVEMAAELGVTHKVMNADFLQEINKKSVHNDDGFLTFVPARNLFLMSLTGIYAFHNGIRNIYTGVSQSDFSGYPDCRHAFVSSLETTLSLGMDVSLNIHTPLMYLNKEQTWALAYSISPEAFELVKSKSLTCYNNNTTPRGCGECAACKLRNKGLDAFEKGLKDGKYKK